MIELLKLYSKYNQQTNSAILDLLNKLPEDELSFTRNMYYKSIRNQLNHLAQAGWFYLNAVKYIVGIPLPSEDERKNVFLKIENSFEDVGIVIKSQDQELSDLMEKLTEEQLKIQKKNIRIYNGRKIDITSWEYLTQHIIHQTHHRGQLSQILDELGIENDFGNIFPLIQDSIPE